MIAEAARLEPAPRRDDAPAGLADLRFRRLLPSEHWDALPAAVRKRFAKRLGPGEIVVYRGRVEAARASRVGRLLAELCRLIGGPLPTGTEIGVASVVTVTEDAGTEDAAAGGQVWTRLYARRDGFPQVIHSAKRFAGETGLEEHVGAGIGMSLAVGVEDDALVFRQHRYFLALGRHRVKIPCWLAPGRLTVRHIDLGHGRFAFTLDIVHPWFGELLHQRVIFEDC